MPDEALGTLRTGYVLERSSSAPEPFVAREILEMERQGVNVHIFRLDLEESTATGMEEAGRPAGPASAQNGRDGFDGTWDRLRRRILERRGRHADLRRALILALDHPARNGRRCLEEALKLAEWAEKLGLQHLHAHSARNPAFVAMLGSLLSGIPYSFTAHGRDLSAAGPPFRQWKRQLRHARFAVMLAEASTSHLRRKLDRRAAGRMRLLHSGIDLEATRPPADRFSSRIPRILCVSRLVEKMGVDILLKALDQVVKPKARFACTIVGEGAQEIHLKQQAVRAGLEEQVEFTSDLSHQDLIRLLRGADVVVLARRVVSEDDLDALPVILLEAMAAGIPCVVTPVGGVAEIVSDLESGLIVEPEDALALGAALLRLIESPDLRRELGDGGRLRAERLFDLRRNVQVLRGWFAESALLAREQEVREEEPAFGRRALPAGLVSSQDLRGRADSPHPAPKLAARRSGPG